MIWQFGELGYDFSIDENGRVGKKPIKWDYQNDPDRQHLYQVFSALIKLKTQEAAFSSEDYNLSVTGALKRVKINHPDMDVRVIGNFDVKSGNISPNFSKTGSWYDYFSGAEVSVSDVNMNVNLSAGEYRIYTTKQLETPAIPSAPIASNLTISGKNIEGEVLNASYTYFDVNGDIEGNSIIQWYRSDDTNASNEIAIQDANEMSYNLTLQDVGKFIRFSVSPIATSGDILKGKKVYSSYHLETAVVSSAPIVSELSLSGEAKEDEVITAAYTYTDANGDIEGKSVIQWYRADNNTGGNEITIQGANELNYTIIRQDVGMYLRVSVTPVAVSGDYLTGDKVYSAYTQEIQAVTGIDDVLDKELQLYPNPVKDLLHLDNLNKVKRVSLFNLTGKTVLYKNNPNSNEILNLRNFSQGIYIIVFDLEDGSRLTRKIVKQ